LAAGLRKVYRAAPLFSLQESVMPRATTSLLAAALLAASAVASAQMMLSPVYATYGAPMSNFLSSSYLLNQSALAAVGSRSKSTGSSSSSSKPLDFPVSAVPIVPRKLAAGYPPAQRADAEKLFQQTLEGYHGIESKFGLRRNDIAGAVAAFIAGNYIAYHDQPFPDAHFGPLVRQMRERMYGVPALRSASAAERQEMYEQLAILGTYMALTREALQKTPDPKLKDGMKRAARNYLEQFLRIDPDRIRIGPEGLTVS
jgi:hypothetical protein